MNVIATSEKTAQTLATWKVPYGSYWWAIRVVGWISQDTTNLRTTLYFKWQIGAFNYWPYWDDPHTYTVSLGGNSKSCSFKMSQDMSNTYKDKSSVQSITVSHDGSTGAYSGTIRFQGYKCWEAFDYSEACSFPTITPPAEPSPDPEPEPSQEDDNPYIPNDKDPRYFILCDDEVLYSVNDEEHIVLDPKLTLEVNQNNSLTFLVPPGNVMYPRLNKLGSTIEVYQGSEILFRGRVLDDDSDFYNRKNVHCEGALSFLGDTLMSPYAQGTYATADALFKAAIDSHSSQVPANQPQRKLVYKKCNITNAIDNSNDEYSYTSDVISNLVSENGGYIKLDYNLDKTTDISYVSSYGHTSGQYIDFGENLLDLTITIDASEVYTSVVALGKKNENTGVRLNTGSGSAMYTEDADAIDKFGRIIRTFTYDDVTSQSELQKLASYLLTIGINSVVTIEIKAIDLHLVYPEIEKIRIGDSVYIRSAPHQIDGYYQCSKIELDLQNPDNSNYVFGATLKSLTDLS